ncbi:pyrroline-5-carboxylate reductase [Paraburkholderia silvatlantica]|uniref:Pyrroline-5-carboxylate reductase n=1 Tax=Paraburkholderia silvatlantica TaxID=321895 RepID=A0ABR6FVI4_9BURK|nr:pyrroline-5-carboxylate reductase [Paraburkholderia silvatlantica]MBB2931436.1 pyrroline-5-carboxylate reductase [Paraburkholderia silvatlantica]PVY27897.1 pyrroline-5-carboxylate reductase [Paraburkholderia silvatlantica]PXW34744.1 pyrroline-5-carboxylate reductase [Paraburkholderia silvatlantica]TDQ98610.1 pyrroline-5-carboxylate reductase [Paraburkholderia silvatlantica]
MKIAFIGAGNMASALIGGLIGRGAAPGDITAVDPGAQARAKCSATFGIEARESVDAGLPESEVIVLAVKPQQMKSTCASISPLLRGQLVISVAAGVRVQELSNWLGGHARVVRAMPNTPALIGLGATGLFASPEVGGDDRENASTILGAVGIVSWLDAEDDLDSVTAISGSGPAYVFYFIEAMQAAAEEFGFSSAQARTLTLATFKGAVQLASESADPVSVLRECVTSKGGTTAAALATFAQADVAASIKRGALAAKVRSKQLGDELASA